MNKTFIDKYLESVIRIFFLTMFMTAIVTFWKLWYNANYYINWMKTWAIVALIAYIFMCFIIRPSLLDPLKLKWYKREIIWMFLLITIFTFVFSYRFDWLRLNNIVISRILKNFFILTIIVFPVGLWLAGPIANILYKKSIK